ncbi:MAG: helix-turn-helix domain-containing protein [Reyranella sp.]|jgi:DNA-binding transcriptional regulator YiaG|nr:helix-turn-helix domain-containing protein [Reyranella sp.]
MTDRHLFHYTQSGLDNVWLANGWRREKTDYGPAFAIDHAETLHRAIADAIVRFPGPLRGQEARFLRTVLGLSQEHFAKLLGVDRATVIRWEKARTAALDRAYDIAVRASYEARAAASSLVFKIIREMQEADDRDHARGHRHVFETAKAGWRERKQAA